jgi:hypothetical protein
VHSGETQEFRRYSLAQQGCVPIFGTPQISTLGISGARTGWSLKPDVLQRRFGLLPRVLDVGLRNGFALLIAGPVKDRRSPQPFHIGQQALPR